MSNTFRSGDYKVECDRCGRAYFRSECTKTWDNLIVCGKCYDGPRDPQDYRVRYRADRQLVFGARPEPAIVWIAERVLLEDGAYLLTEDNETLLRNWN